jgi:hypothetical protein
MSAFSKSSILILALVLAPAAFAQDSTPEKKEETPKKKKKKEKEKEKEKPKAAEPEKPKDAPPPVETTLIEPSLVYRIGKLWPRSQSVYHKVDHGDYFDQVYATLKFQKTLNYVHTLVIEPGLRTKRENPAAWDDSHHFEQAYIESAITDKLLLTAGKKTEFEGSGFIVNPSDLINEDKDILDTIYQKEGVVLTRLKYRLPGDFSLGLGFLPVASSSTNKGRALMQVSGEVKQIEVRLMVTEHEREKTTTGLSLQRFFGEKFEQHFDGRYQARQRDPSGAGNDYLLFSQYHSNDPKKPDDPSGYYLGGSRLVLTPRRTWVLEAIQQQSGLLHEDFQKFFASKRESNAKGFQPSNPPTKLTGRHYVFTSVQDDDSLPSTHLSANYLLNTDDKSSFTVLSARYALSSLTSIELSPSFFKGKTDTEFGEEPFAQAYYIIFRGRF